MVRCSPELVEGEPRTTRPRSSSAFWRLLRGGSDCAGTAPQDERVARRSPCLLALALVLASGTGAYAQPLELPDAAANSADPSAILNVNVIDGADERDSLLAIGAQLGLSSDEIARIRKVSGYVGCFLPNPSVGTGALYLTNQQILTAGHIFFEPSGERRSSCFFRSPISSP